MEQIFFKKSPEYLKFINQLTEKPRDLVSFGIPYLDDALDGINEDDFVIITAATGAGKTETATSIAYNAVKTGKRVHYFALEAHKGEIEARIKFKALAHAFYIQKNYHEFKETPDYQKWINGLQFNLLGKFYNEVDESLTKELNTLNLFYGDHEFDMDKFEGLMGQIGDQTDLVILDHAHHISFEDANENMAFKKMIRQLKKIVTFYRRPLVVIAQLRKTEKFSERLLPSVDDISGASELAKIATRIIATAPAKDTETEDKTILPTYFRILKNRLSGARTFYVSLCGYDLKTNLYKNNYHLGILKENDSLFERVESWNYPQWAKTAKI